MEFKTWLEIIELRKPSGKVVKRAITKDPGTNVAKKIFQFQYTTKLGNVVKLQFNPMGFGAYNVVFYVNDVLYDNAPQMGADLKPEKYARDTEILPSVFFLIKNKADKMQANTLTFTASSSEGDTKTIRNLDIEPRKNQALMLLNQFMNDIRAYKPKMVPPGPATISLYQKLNKPLPQATVDVDINQWLVLIQKVKISIENNQNIEEFIDYLDTKLGLGKLPINISELISSLKDYNNAVVSNSPQGWRRNNNRRLSIYKRLIDKYFSAEWNVEISHTMFTLTRKSNI